MHFHLLYPQFNFQFEDLIEAVLKNNLLEMTATIGTLTMAMTSFECYKNIVHWVNSGETEALVFEGTKPGEKYSFGRVS